MSKGFCNISIKTKKFCSTSQNSLVNLGKHLLRIDEQKSKLIDRDKTKDNEILIQMDGENLSKSLKNFLKNNDLKVVRKDQIQAYQVIFSCDKKTFEDPELLEKWKIETLKFINTNNIFKDNCLLAVFHKDEIQPHIQAVFVPRVDKKLAFNKILGGQDGGIKLGKLHDEYAKYHEPLGFERGDGTHTNGLSFKDYKKAVGEVAKPVEKIEVLEEKKILGVVVNKQEIIDSQAQQLRNLKREKKKLYFYENQNNSLKKNQKKLKEKAKVAVELEKKVVELEQIQKQSIEKNQRFKQIFNENIELSTANEELKNKNSKLQNKLKILKSYITKIKTKNKIVEKAEVASDKIKII